MRSNNRHATSKSPHFINHLSKHQFRRFSFANVFSHSEILSIHYDGWKEVDSVCNWQNSRLSKTVSMLSWSKTVLSCLYFMQVCCLFSSRRRRRSHNYHYHEFITQISSWFWDKRGTSCQNLCYGLNSTVVIAYLYMMNKRALIWSHMDLDNGRLVQVNSNFKIFSQFNKQLKDSRKINPLALIIYQLS